MKKNLNLDEMSVDEMWQLHEEIARILSVRLTSEKRELEKRLTQLRRDKEMSQPRSEKTPALKNAGQKRRKYPRVFPKYRNPNEPTETWSGRGKLPRWLAAELKSGRTIDEFVIGDQETHKSSFR